MNRQDHPGRGDSPKRATSYSADISTRHVLRRAERPRVMPLLDLFWAVLWISLWFLWIWLVISVFIDIFRSGDLSGWLKAIWCLFVLIVPVIGVLVYLVARGGTMQQRRADDIAARDAASRQHIREAAGTGSSASDELAKLAQLRDQGVLSDDEFQSQKAKILA